tara:strand:- start:2606 stop:3376 length:771 start_codon:yes stop_codon:yes gene_type:complete
MKRKTIYTYLKNKVVLITGGASGIGEEIVDKFLNQNSKVVFIDNNESKGNRLVIRLNKKYKTKLHFYKCNLKDTKKLQKTIVKIKKEVGPISILVNNAANDERHDIDTVTPEYWDDRMNINLKHYFFASQSVYKQMKKIGHGSIINIGSFSWMLSQGGMPGYTTAKSAIVGLTKTLARDLGVYNIRVNSIIPGWIITQRQKKLWLTKKIERNQLAKQCLKRMLLPDDIAKVVLFFASEESSGCTSQNYIVDGGTVT